MARLERSGRPAILSAAARAKALLRGSAGNRAMTDGKYRQNPDDRANDTRLTTPLVLMGLIIAAGLLFQAYRGESTAPTLAQAPATQSAH
jgi:hypothetical protein